MPKLTREVWAEINLRAFAHNLRRIRNLAPKAQMMLVLKADGYGHGALALGECALGLGISYFAVATFDEAMELRGAFKESSIFILGSTPLCNATKIVKHDIEVCVYNKNLAEALSKEAQKQNKKAVIHIKLETGMNRIGYSYNPQSLEEIHYIARLPHIHIKALFTHFATADCADSRYLHTQEQRFLDFVHAIDTKVLWHCANSAAIINAPQSHYDIIRPGIMSYGLKPACDMDMQGLDLKPVMSLKAKIVHIKEIQPNQSVGYNQNFIAPKTLKIATLPIGYADGYMRLLSNKAEVLIHGHRARVVGNICMDSCMVDVSAITQAQIGDTAVLFGTDEHGGELSVDELAQHVGSINYEMVCAISRRVPRVYV